jgi:hypothetical protein
VRDYRRRSFGRGEAPVLISSGPSLLQWLDIPRRPGWPSADPPPLPRTCAVRVLPKGCRERAPSGSCPRAAANVRRPGLAQGLPRGVFSPGSGSRLRRGLTRAWCPGSRTYPYYWDMSLTLSAPSAGGRGPGQGGRRRQRAGRGVIVQDFAFRGNKAANRLLYFRDHGPGRSGVGAIRGGTGTARRPAHRLRRPPGLLRLEENGHVRVLADSYGGRRLKLTNNAAVAADGTGYFSDSWTRFRIEHYSRTCSSIGQRPSLPLPPARCRPGPNRGRPVLLERGGTSPGRVVPAGPQWHSIPTHTV